MTWLETLSAALAPGAGGAILAAAIYRGSVLIEGEMRKEAIADVARFINNAQIKPDSQGISTLILHAFEVIFGKNHWTLKCLIRSILASSIFFVIISTALLWGKGDKANVLLRGFERPTIWEIMVLVSFVPDYLSLFKGRLILQRIAVRATIPKMVTLVLLDLVISICISYVAWMSLGTTYGIIHDINAGAVINAKWVKGVISFNSCQFTDLTLSLFRDRGQNPWCETQGASDFAYLFVSIVFVTTAMTSMWSALIMLAGLVLRLLGSLNVFLRFIRWMFDVDVHPVRVLGLAAAAVVWASAVVYGLL
jgi:hypothetical protein